MARVRVSELAKRLNTSTTTIYKHMKRLQERLSAHIIKEPGTTYLSEEGAEIIKASMQATTTTPTSAAVPASIQQTAPGVDLSPLMAKLDDLGRAMVALAGEVQTLRQENAALKVLLLPAPSKPVEVWQPEPARPDPREGKNIFQRIFLELFQPDKLRRFAS